MQAVGMQHGTDSVTHQVQHFTDSVGCQRVGGTKPFESYFTAQHIRALKHLKTSSSTFYYNLWGPT